jgi:hypothetical protein
MARHARPALALGCLSVCAGGVVLLAALYLGFYIEADLRAMARSAKGHQIAVPAVVAVVVGFVAVAGHRRRWGLAVACVAAAAAVVAVLLTILIPNDG